MVLRIATFNAENLMHRFDFSGFQNEMRRDRALQILDVQDKEQYKQLEQARVVAHTDDAMQLTALAIADTRADIVCLQEVENLEALKAFEYGYLYKMVGQGYRHKYLIDGNDSRGIDVAVMTREETATGDAIEFLGLQSHAQLTFDELGLHTPKLGELGLEPGDRIFKRDCLELDFRIGGKRFSLFVVHFKSMSGTRDGIDGRTWTMPIRAAEAQAVRHIIETKFGDGRTANKRWMVCGDMNDYRSKILVHGDRFNGYSFETFDEPTSGFDPLIADGFSVDLGARIPDLERWTLFHSRGPEERHLCQLDYMLASPKLVETNPKAEPKIIHSGQPFRTPFPKGQAVERYPRAGWDRPKASDHSPMVVELQLV